MSRRAYTVVCLARHGIGPIVDQHRDRAAFGEAETVLQRVGDAVRKAVDLAERPAFVAEPDRDAVAMIKRAAADDLGDQHPMRSRATMRRAAGRY